MLGQKDDLADVRGVMSQLAIDRLKDGMRLPADRHGSHHVFRPQRFYRSENIFPALLPPLDHFSAFSICVNDEFLIAMTVRLFAVARQKIHPARAHVAGQMFDDDRDAVAFGIERHKELSIVELRHSAVALLLQVSEFGGDVFQVMPRNFLRHVVMAPYYRTTE